MSSPATGILKTSGVSNSSQSISTTSTTNGTDKNKDYNGGQLRRELSVTPSVQFSQTLDNSCPCGLSTNAKDGGDGGGGGGYGVKSFLTNIQQQACAPFSRCRARILKMLHCRLTLMAICVLVLIECVCVMSELMVDLHGIKLRFDTETEEVNKFVSHFRSKHPEAFESFELRRMKDFMHLLKTSTKYRPVDAIHHQMCNTNSRENAGEDTMMAPPIKTVTVTGQIYHNGRNHIYPHLSPSPHQLNSIQHDEHQSSNTIHSTKNSNKLLPNGELTNGNKEYRTEIQENVSKYPKFEDGKYEIITTMSSPTKKQIPNTIDDMNIDSTRPTSHSNANSTIHSTSNSSFTRTNINSTSNLSHSKTESLENITNKMSSTILITNTVDITTQRINEVSTKSLPNDRRTGNDYPAFNTSIGRNESNTNTLNASEKNTSFSPTFSSSQTMVLSKSATVNQKNVNANVKAKVQTSITIPHNASDVSSQKQQQKEHQQQQQQQQQQRKQQYQHQQRQQIQRLKRSKQEFVLGSVNEDISNGIKNRKSNHPPTQFMENMFVLTINNADESFLIMAELLPAYVKSNGSLQSRYMEEFKNVYKTTKALHYTSVTILGIMVVETIIKLFCKGSGFFKEKLEVFDAFIVILSFCLDVTFLDSRWYETGKDATALLLLLLPWRVVRIVNSFVMTIKHKHHLQMVHLKRGKKKAELKTVKVQSLLKEIRKDVQLLVNLCKSANVEESSINACLYGKGRSNGATQIFIEACTSVLLVSTLGQSSLPQEDELYGTLFQEVLAPENSTLKSPQKQQEEEAAIDAAIALDDKIEAKRKSSRRKPTLSIRLRKALVKRSHTMPRRCASLELPDTEAGVEADGMDEPVVFVQDEIGDIVPDGDYVIIDSDGRYYVGGPTLPVEDGGSFDGTQRHRNDRSSEL